MLGFSSIREKKKRLKPQFHYLCAKMSFKGGVQIQDDITVNKFGIIILLGWVWMYAGKREGFGRGRRENEYERKKERSDIS